MKSGVSNDPAFFFGYLLCISGLDDTENHEIYKTYMHFGGISYTGR